LLEKGKQPPSAASQVSFRADDGNSHMKQRDQETADSAEDQDFSSHILRTGGGRRKLEESGFGKTIIQAGGEGGIRTHDGQKGHNGFRDRPVQPLWHLSEGKNYIMRRFEIDRAARVVCGRIPGPARQGGRGRSMIGWSQYGLRFPLLCSHRSAIFPAQKPESSGEAPRGQAGQALSPTRPPLSSLGFESIRPARPPLLSLGFVSPTLARSSLISLGPVLASSLLLQMHPVQEPVRHRRH
jgi:hypothetical protein